MCARMHIESETGSARVMGHKCLARDLCPITRALSSRSPYAYMHTFISNTYTDHACGFPLRHTCSMKGMVAQGLPKWVKKGATAISDEFLRSARGRRVDTCKHVRAYTFSRTSYGCARAHTSSHTCAVLLREHART